MGGDKGDNRAGFGNVDDFASGNSFVDLEFGKINKDNSFGQETIVLTIVDSHNQDILANF